MSEELDKQLGDALRPVDPGEQFAHGVLSRVARDPASRRARMPWRWQWAAALAVVVLGTLGVYQLQMRRAQGLEARRQLIQALQVTGEKLDLAERAVNDSAGSRADPGA